MKNSTKLITCLSTFCLALTGNAFAQDADPAFSNASEDDMKELKEGVKGVEWKAGALGGLILTTGNARSTTMSAGATASRKEGNNKLSLAIDGSYARSSIFLANDGNADGMIAGNEYARSSSTTARSLAGKARYDRFLSEMDAVYASIQAMTNEPAGKELVVGAQLGYSRTVFKNDKHSLLAEVGYDFAHEVPVGGDGYEIHSIRAFAGYQSKLSDDTGFDASVEGLFNVNEIETHKTIDRFKDTRVNGTLSLTTKLFEDISFRFGFSAMYDQSPSLIPAFSVPFVDGLNPEAQNLDTKTEATLIINFL